MNKTKLIITATILCAIGIVGCTNETDEAIPQKDKQAIMTVRADASAPQTRADYTDDDTKMKFSWRSGDALSVAVMDESGVNTNCHLTTTEEGNAASFSGKVTAFTGSKTIYAFYPANVTTAYTVTGGDNSETATAALTLPNPQLYSIGGAISNSFMVGTGSAAAEGDNITANAKMKQVMSIIKLNITNAPGKVVSVTLKCSKALFPTAATVALKDATIKNPKTLVKELTMNVTDNTTDTDKSVSFAMFPTAALIDKEITIEVKFFNEANYLVKAMKKTGINFDRNIHYVMAFDASSSTVIEYIEANGIKVAIGNLIADGNNRAMIGSPDDRGLFFQFGSLVGWKEDGFNAIIAASPENLKATSRQWIEPAKTWQQLGTIVPLPGMSGFSEINGVGDPCRYYLGFPWRLPTKDEIDQLFKTSPTNTWWSDGWSFNDNFNSGYAYHTGGLKFQASGRRDANGDLSSNIGTQGLYWSSWLTKASDGYTLFFNDLLSRTDEVNVIMGLPVRCVQEK